MIRPEKTNHWESTCYPSSELSAGSAAYRPRDALNVCVCTSDSRFSKRQLEDDSITQNGASRRHVTHIWSWTLGINSMYSQPTTKGICFMPHLDQRRCVYSSPDAKEDHSLEHLEPSFQFDILLASRVDELVSFGAFPRSSPGRVTKMSPSGSSCSNDKEHQLTSWELPQM